MKYLLLILPLLQFANYTIASDTIVVDNSKVWAILHSQYPTNGGGNQATWFYKFENDTLINNNTYLKVIRNDVNNQSFVVSLSSTP